MDQVRELGMKYNIITPYTSFVVMNPKGLPQTGLPLLYVDEYRTLNTGLMWIGVCLVLLGLTGLILGKLRR